MNFSKGIILFSLTLNLFLSLVIVKSERQCGMPPNIQSVLADLKGAAVLTDEGNSIWPNGIVYYQIDTNYFSTSQVNTIKEGMRMIETQTKLDGYDCIKFVQRTTEKNYLKIENGKNCWSFVGKFVEQKPQTVSLEAPGCVSKDTVAHELIHALGFHHEQCRPDRDSWIDVFYGNIIQSAKYNFDKVNNFNNLGTPYDYKSIMHYDDRAFAINRNQLTLQGKKGKIEPGEVLSEIDVQEIRKLYNCKSKSTKNEITWEGNIGKNCDIPTKSFKTAKAKSVNECETVCRKTDGCLSFVLKTDNCYLKNDIVYKSTAIYFASSICGLVAESHMGFSQKLLKTRLFGHYKHTILETVDKCWNSCSSEIECKSVTFDHKYSICFFYNTDSPANSFDENFTSITKLKGILWRGNIGSNCDFPGNDLKTVQTNNGNECDAICKKTSGCTSFTWNPYFNNSCYIKSKTVIKSNALFLEDWLKAKVFGIVCGVVSKTEKIIENFDKKDGVQVTKYFYKSFQNVNSAEDCVKSCDEDLINCNVASFSTSSKICYLFQKSTESVENKGYVSFFKKSSTDTIDNFERNNNLQITKYFYHSVQSKTPIECVKVCSIHEMCNVATFDLTTKVCYLFEKSSGSVENSDYVSYKRKISTKMG